MKETNFSEKESLELIAQMIQQTKDNMKVGNGNVLLYYGYPAILIALFTGFENGEFIMGNRLVPDVCARHIA